MPGRTLALSGEAMFATPAYAQAANAAVAGSGWLAQVAPMLPLVAIAILGYFLMIRPQSQRMKQHQATVAALKRGDVVVLSSGMIGKVVRVEDKEVGLEIATGVTVKVVKTMIADVRARGEPAAANDSKA